jgi:membrane-associated phospholipid phosphatase
MTRSKFAWLSAVLLSLLLYFPINRFAHGGEALALPIDRSIPVFPPAVVPYLLADVVFVGLPVWAAYRAKPAEFKSYAISLLAATFVSYAIYLAFPTFAARPEITANDVFSRLLKLLYQADKTYNAAPSGHAMYSTLAFVYLARWKPRLWPLWLGGAVLVFAAALLTKQHNVLDVVIGVILGGAAYLAGLYMARTRRRPSGNAAAV